MVGHIAQSWWSKPGSWWGSRRTNCIGNSSRARWASDAHGVPKYVCMHVPTIIEPTGALLTKYSENKVIINAMLSATSLKAIVHLRILKKKML